MRAASQQDARQDDARLTRAMAARDVRALCAAMRGLSMMQRATRALLMRERQRDMRVIK